MPVDSLSTGIVVSIRSVVYDNSLLLIHFVVNKCRIIGLYEALCPTLNRF